MNSIHQILKQYWGHEKFRPLQEEIINSVLGGDDTLALLPTGGGKSICFQVPAMAKDGLCLVVSPLIALMKDQVENLRKKGITAFSIHAGMNRKEVINTLKVVIESNCKFLYVSPERLESNLFIEYLPSLPINLIAIDEAHCVSQWGYDFRPPYLRIAAIRDSIPGIPVLALTASATRDVQDDICDKLKFKSNIIFRQSFARPNLSYSVFKVDAKINKLIDILLAVPGSNIVYCKSRKRTREIAEQLKTYNISADYYHAGLSSEERNLKQESWIKNQIRTIVCTNAFGMGIDKPDVRTVIHMDLPDCLENYYQEAGRAGRDGQKSYAVLLYQQKDIDNLKAQSKQKFPGMDTIRNIYQSIANYLQLPAGLGEGNYYDFDLADFVKTFKLDLFESMNSLKMLEQEEYLSFNEQVFMPSKASFICTKETLQSFEEAYPIYDPVIKSLLRTYEGIYDQPVPIYEKSIAYLLKSPPEQVKEWLIQLQGHSIIRYEAQKDTAQLYFIRNRAKAEELSIDYKAYNARKQRFEKRVEAFIEYIEQPSNCGSSYIGKYFGDDAIQDCGICDNCLQKKRTVLSSEEFEQIREKLVKTISKNQQVDTKELLKEFKNIHKEKTWQVLQFLQSEQKIHIDTEGVITLC